MLVAPAVAVAVRIPFRGSACSGKAHDVNYEFGYLARA